MKYRNAVISGSPAQIYPATGKRAKSVRPMSWGNGNYLRDPLLLLVEHLDHVAVGHQEQHVDRMGVGQRQDENSGDTRKHA